MARGATEGTYLSLFAEGGFVSPRETTWRHREDPGQILADIAGFYEAFAFRPRVEDPLDHVAVEAGFIGYLCLKEAHALAHGDEESAEITASARRRFIADHLGHFAEKWADRVSATGVPHLVRRRAGHRREPHWTDRTALLAEASTEERGESK